MINDNIEYTRKIAIVTSIIGISTFKTSKTMQANKFFSNEPPTTKNEALQVLRLNKLATLREISLQFRILACRYHPDKWDTSKPFSKDEANKKFKAISNVKELLLD